MRTREEIEEAIRILMQSLSGAEVHGDEVAIMNLSVMIGTLEWVVNSGPCSNFLQSSLDQCKAFDNALKRHGTN